MWLLKHSSKASATGLPILSSSPAASASLFRELSQRGSACDVQGGSDPRNNRTSAGPQTTPGFPQSFPDEVLAPTIQRTKHLSLPVVGGGYWVLIYLVL